MLKRTDSKISYTVFLSASLGTTGGAANVLFCRRSCDSAVRRAMCGPKKGRCVTGGRCQQVQAVALERRDQQDYECRRWNE